MQLIDLVCFPMRGSPGRFLGYRVGLVHETKSAGGKKIDIGEEDNPFLGTPASKR